MRISPNPNALLSNRTKLTSGRTEVSEYDSFGVKMQLLQNRGRCNAHNLVTAYEIW
jgi:hypothetical protein